MKLIEKINIETALESTLNQAYYSRGKEYIRTFTNTPIHKCNFVTGIYICRDDGFDITMVDEERNIYRTNYYIFDENRRGICVKNFETKIYELYEIQKLPLKDAIILAPLIVEL